MRQIVFYEKDIPSLEERLDASLLYFQEISVGTNSLSQSSHQSETTSHNKPALSLPLDLTNSVSETPAAVVNGEEKSTTVQQKTHGEMEWEILEGLREGQKCETKPEKFEGYLMKRRKWPLKGWHKVSKTICLYKILSKSTISQFIRQKW